MGIGEMEFRPEPAAATGAPATRRTIPAVSFAGRGTPILVDPMTRELISAEPMVDALGRERLDPAGKPLLRVHDQWFTLEFKLKWTEAPETPETSG